MAVKNWHYGKLIMLWCWGALLIALMLFILEGMSGHRYVLGTLILLLIFGLPIALSVITWKWLSGKEGSAAD